jgi:hypothetical protein
MDPKDWLIVAATVIGPILAVQAQKMVERIRERRNRKSWVFHTLMATRLARVSPDHVQALNMIDLAFYGSRILGVNRRTKHEQCVLDAWKEYLDHLGTKYEDSQLPLWHTKGEELFVNLLFAIAVDVGFSFDRVQLKKGAYSPIAHGDVEMEQTVIRRCLVKLLSGNSALKMDVVNLPPPTATPRLPEAQTQSLALPIDSKEKTSTSGP